MKKINELEIDTSDLQKSKNNAFIFGLNGSGKTTISRASKDWGYKNTYVFNKDYIIKNVYNEVLEDGECEAENSEQSKEVYKILIGNKLKNLNEKKISLNAAIISSKKTLKELYAFDSVINEIANVLGIQQIINFTIAKAKNLSIDKVITKEEIKSNLFDKYNIFQDGNKFVDIYNQHVKLNKHIGKHSKLLKKYEEMKDLFSVNKWIVNIHKTLEQNMSKDNIKVIQVGDKDVTKAAIFKRYKEINNKKVEIESQIENNINEIDLIIDQILNSNLIKEYSKRYILKKSELSEIKKQISSSLFSPLSVTEIRQLEDTNVIKENLISYMKNNISYLVKDTQAFISEAKSYFNLDHELTELSGKVEKQILLLKKNYEGRMNHFLKALKTPQLQLKFTEQETKTISKFTIGFRNGFEICKLSEGEKKSLALALFLTELENNLSSNKGRTLIFIDDPFDSNDFKKHDSLIDVKLKIRDKNVGLFDVKNSEVGLPPTRIIVTTHDVAIYSSIIIGTLNYSSSKELLFLKPKETSKDFCYFELKRINDKSSFREIDPGFLFPIEENLRKALFNIIKFNLENEVSEEELNSLRIIIIAFIKLVDHYDNNLRNTMTNLVSKIVKIETKPKKSEINKIITNLKTNENWKIEPLEGNIKKIYKMGPILGDVSRINFGPWTVNKDIIIQHLEFIFENVQNIIEEKDSSSLKRLRHKNNYHSSIVGYGISE